MHYINKLIVDHHFNNDTLHIDKSQIDKESLSRLQKENYIQKEGNNYIFNYSNSKIYNIISSELYKNIKNNAIKQEIDNICNILLKKYKSIVSIILIGSAARDKTKIDSDIDFLIISSRKIKKIKIKEKLKIKTDFLLRTEKSFKKDFKSNNELTIWSLKYGIILFEKNKYMLTYLKDLANTDFFQIIENKKNQIKKYVTFLENYNNFIDKESIFYVLDKLYFFIMRLNLYQNNFIPKSKPELEYQIKTHGLKNPLLNTIKAYLKTKTISKKNLIELLNSLNIQYPLEHKFS